MTRALTRRRLLEMGAVAAIAAACAPAASSPPPPTPVGAATRTAVPTVAATQGRQAPAPATPSPQRTPFDFAKMRDPLIDSHTHPIVPQQGDQTRYYDGLVQLMDQNDVAYSVMHRNAQWATPGATFGKDHDEWVRAAMDRHPGRILGGLGGFDPSSPDAPAYVRAQLQTGKWAFVGELDLRNPGPKTQIPINSPIMMQIHKIAAEFRVPLVFHYNADYGTGDPQIGFREIEDAVKQNPATTFVFAHNPPAELMPRYPNLWGEMTLFNLQFPTEQVLRMLSRTPDTLDRLVLCLTDVQTPDLRITVAQPPMSYAEAVNAARSVLAKQSPEVRDKIAYKNLMRLLKLQ